MPIASTSRKKTPRRHFRRAIAPLALVGTILAGVACAASPLALVLSLAEIAQLLVDLHLKAIA